MKSSKDLCKEIISNDHFIVQVISAGHKAGNYAKIMINSLPILSMKKNENGHLRGFHIVTINPVNGKVKDARVFDTYRSSEKFDEFIMTSIPHGYIVALAGCDDCVNNIS